VPRPAAQSGGPIPDRGLLGDVRSFLEAEITSAEATHPHFVKNLPPIVLETLLAIPPLRLGQRLSEVRSSWESARNRLLGEQEGRETISPVVGARILAHHILNGVRKPVSVLRLGKSVLSQNWRNYEFDEQVVEVVGDSLELLRSPWSETTERIDAINNVATVLNDAPYWPHIENALFHQVFNWPLLVFAHGHDAVSLPVGIDISFDRTGTVKTIPNRGGFLNVSAWAHSLRDAAKAAKVLWRGKHGNFGSFRDAVYSANVIFDFRVAEQIVEGFAESITLEDSSMEAYFSQVVLSRILGNIVSSASVVTGSIGRRRLDEPGGFADYEFLWPGSVSSKLKYVFRTRFFERVVLPDIDERDERRAEVDNQLLLEREGQTTELHYAKHLQHVADSFQVGGWRQFRYVRCPDIAWRIHSSGNRLPDARTDSIKTCLTLLRENQSAILELPPELSTVDLAAALWHINITMRSQIPLAIPPMLSWTFIRAVSDEVDTRFWRVLWEQTGAGMKAYRNFHHAGTTELAAHWLANALNTFTPHVERPGHRAPDITVLIGTENLSASLGRAKNPLLRCQAFDPVIAYMKAKRLLEPTPDIKMRDLIGQTRIVIVCKHDVPDDPITGPRHALTESDKTLLQLLSVFRFGFTQQMAAFIWDCAGYELPVREKLAAFVSRGLLRYVFGEYYLPGKVGLAEPSGGNSRERAKAHYLAGLAFAPYTSVGPVPGLSFDQAFQAEHVHEAHFHLHEAHDLLEKSDTDPFRAKTSAALLRLQRFGEYPGWDVVDHFLKAGNAARDAYELSMELLADRVGEDIPPHPIQVLMAARAAEQRWIELRNNAAFKAGEEVIRLRDQIDELFSQAAQACERPEYSPERQYNRLNVLSRCITFLEKHGESASTALNTISLPKLRAEAWQLLECGADGSAARGEWYESEGDRNENHALAARAYEHGVRWTPEWHQLWIKMLGCSGVGSDGVIDQALLPDLGTRVKDILKFSLPGLRRDRKQGRPWIKERWVAGLNECEKQFARVPGVKRQLDLYRSELLLWGGHAASQGVDKR